MTDAKSITEAHGGAWHGTYGMGYCPAHDNTKTPALSIADGENGKLLLHCFAGCSFYEVIGALNDLGILNSQLDCAGEAGKPLQKAVNASSLDWRSKRAQSVWLTTQPIQGTLAEVYLASRAIECGSHATLRYSPCCHHPSGEFLPAMVGLVEGSDGFAVHCTFLDPDTGQKADVDPPKIMLGPCKGGAVRLFQGTENTLIVSEGIETLMSLFSGNSPPPLSGWAALSTSGMMSLRLPPNPHKLFIASDGDIAGHCAAYDLAERAKALGWNVFLLQAPDDMDWNDVLREGEKCH